MHLLTVQDPLCCDSTSNFNLLLQLFWILPVNRFSNQVSCTQHQDLVYPQVVPQVK